MCPSGATDYTMINCKRGSATQSGSNGGNTDEQAAQSITACEGIVTVCR